MLLCLCPSLSSVLFLSGPKPSSHTISGEALSPERAHCNTENRQAWREQQRVQHTVHITLNAVTGAMTEYTKGRSHTSSLRD